MAHRNTDVDRSIIDMSELLTFSEHLEEAPNKLKKAAKKMMREQGNKLRRKTAQRARVTVNKTAVNRAKYQREAGHYHKRIKRGKLYNKQGAHFIRVYSNDPVAHLIEDGYTPVMRDTAREARDRAERERRAREGRSRRRNQSQSYQRNERRGNHQAGKKVFEKAREAFEPEFQEASEDLINGIINDL